MKLHKFRTEAGNRIFFAYTSDKRRKSLRTTVELHDEGKTIKIESSSWKYVGQVSSEDIDSENRVIVYRELQSNGFAIVGSLPIVRNFYVFDWKLDRADLRIYSAEKNLAAFKRRHHFAKMSTKGHLISGNEPEYVGEVDIPDKAAASRLGLDYEQLQLTRFQVAFLRALEKEQAIERHLKRELPKKLEKTAENMGMIITDIYANVCPINSHAKNPKPSVPTDINPSETTQSQEVNINIQNEISSVNDNARGYAEDRAGFLRGSLVILIGLIAAIITIYTFASDSDWFNGIVENLVSVMKGF